MKIFQNQDGYTLVVKYIERVGFVYNMVNNYCYDVFFNSNSQYITMNYASLEVANKERYELIKLIEKEK